MQKNIENLIFYQETENQYLVGMSACLQDELGDISFAEFLEKSEWKKNEAFLSVEATKRVMDILAPVNAKVLALHEEVTAQPELLNSIDKADNWVARIELYNPKDVLDVKEDE